MEIVCISMYLIGSRLLEYLSPESLWREIAAYKSNTSFISGLYRNFRRGRETVAGSDKYRRAFYSTITSSQNNHASSWLCHDGILPCPRAITLM